jgi:hypothetical protein
LKHGGDRRSEKAKADQGAPGTLVRGSTNQSQRATGFGAAIVRSHDETTQTLADLLREMEKAKGAQGQLIGPGIIGGNSVRPPTETKTLADLGISKTQSSRSGGRTAEPPERVLAKNSPTK